MDMNGLNGPQIQTNIGIELMILAMFGININNKY